MQHNQVFVIQVSSGAASNKPPLALPPASPESAVLPSEVKYSASLVRGLGLAHLFLGCVIFLLGVLGTWIEPETCWAGAGVWTGLAALLCGMSGLVVHCFWYKNFSIKAFLVTSVVCVVLCVLAIVLSIYAIVNRHKHFQTLLDQMDEHSWFQPYDMNKEHRLTLNISANLLVGFFLELGLALWSSRVGWRGVQTPEYSAATKRDGEAVDPRSVTPLPPRPGQQVPLAALYQLLQAHPEMLGNKGVEGGLVPSWISSSLGDHPTHHSMDYQERVNRFLSNAIEDQNPCLSRPLSALLSENRDSSSTATSSGGRCSPADTLPMPPPDQAHSGRQRRETMEREMQERYSSTERKPKQTQVETHFQRDTASERKVKQTHVDKLPNGHTSNERKVKETHVDTLSNVDTSSERKVKLRHADKLANASSEGKVKEIHTDTLPNRDSSSERKVKQRHADKVPNGHTSSERKVKETHIDTIPNRDSSSDRKVKETHVDTLPNRDSSSERKVKPRHADKLPNGHTSNERKIKETHVDTLLNIDTSSERKVKEIHVDTLPNRDSSSERKVKSRHADKQPNGHTSMERKIKETHVDTLLNGDSSNEKKVKETHVDTMRPRRGSEHKPKAPVPKVRRSESLKSNETSNKGSVKDESVNNVEVAVEKSRKEEKREVPNEPSPVVEKENTSKEDVTKSITEVTDPNVQSRKADKAEKSEKHKKKKSKKSSEASDQETKLKSNGEISGQTIENTDTHKSDKEERKVRKEKKEKRKKENKGEDEKCNDTGSSVDILALASSIQPPCEFQDT